MEEMIYSGGWSTGYKDGNVFRKYLNYNREDALLREVKYSKIAYELNIKTPLCIGYGFSEVKNKHYIDFEFYSLKQLSKFELFKENRIMEVYNIISKMGEYECQQIKDNYWTNNLIEEFIKVLNYLKTYMLTKNNVTYDIDSKVKFLNQLKINTFIHGDFSLNNIYDVNGELLVVDYQHACIGPKNWDMCYLISTTGINCDVVKTLECMSKEDLNLIKIISEIRLGRAIRKSKDIDIRYDLMLKWEKFLRDIGW